tara:strand:+ start:22913 stop:23050 length:138 start_codon:yes stop_codon:yes gene_type:complete
MNSSGGINPKINSEKKNRTKTNDEDKSNEKIVSELFKSKYLKINL